MKLNEFKQWIQEDLSRLDLPFYDAKKLKFIIYTGSWRGVELHFTIPYDSWKILTMYALMNNCTLSYEDGKVLLTSFNKTRPLRFKNDK